MSTRLNPNISEVSVGTRTLRKITIYPLSIGHQLKIKELVTSLFSLLENKPEIDLNGADHSEMEALIAEEGLLDEGVNFVENIVGVLTDSIEQVIEFTTDENANVTVDEITNNQFVEILEIVVNNNFEVPGKKLKKVAAKVKELFPSMK